MRISFLAISLVLASAPCAFAQKYETTVGAGGGGGGSITLTGDTTGTGTRTIATTTSSINGVTINLGGAFTTIGANLIRLTSTGTTNLTLPVSGTLATTANVSSSLGTALPSEPTTTIYGGSGAAGTAAAIPAGQIPGTATNDNASAGNVGEYIAGSSTVCSASGTPLASGTGVTVSSISLSPGDWDVTGWPGLFLSSTTASTRFSAGLTTNTTVAPGAGSAGAIYLFNTITGNGSNVLTSSIPATRFSLSTTTTINLVLNDIFTVSTAFGCGTLDARRVR